MKKRLPAIILSILCAAAGFGLLRYSASVSDAVREGLKVCAGVVIPSLFPFMALSAFIAGSKAAHYLSIPLLPLTRLLQLPRSLGPTVLMSFIGGYPVGARLIAMQLEEGSINSRTASRMLCFCCNAGPSFIISAVGARLLHSTSAGIVLLVSHMLGSVIIGIITSRKEPAVRDGNAACPDTPAASAFVSAVRLSSSSMLVMCSFIVLFYAISALLLESGFTNTAAALLGSWLPSMGEQFWLALITGMLEVTSGCIAAVSSAGAGPFWLTAFLISFSGICVICQIISCFSGKSVDFRPFIISRFAHGFITVLISYPLLRIFCRVLPSSTNMPPSMHMQPNTPLITLCLISMCCLLVASAGNTAKYIKKR